MIRKQYVKAATYEEDSFVEYVAHMDNIASKYNMYVTGDSPETFSVQVSPNDGYPLPTIEVSSELDSDGETDYIYFMPKVTFPVLDSANLSYADTIQFLLSTWADEIGGFCKELIQNPYSIDRYSYDEED